MDTDDLSSIRLPPGGIGNGALDAYMVDNGICPFRFYKFASILLSLTQRVSYC
ncbi:hypothetical protein [Candidatus Nitrosocosmicus sp. T]